MGWLCYARTPLSSPHDRKTLSFVSISEIYREIRRSRDGGGAGVVGGGTSGFGQAKVNPLVKTNFGYILSWIAGEGH